MFRTLDSRQKITYLYLSLLCGGSEIGVFRHNSVKPQEYATILESKLTDCEDEIVGITSAFINARYIKHPVTEGQVNAKRKLMVKIQATIQKQHKFPC